MKKETINQEERAKKLWSILIALKEPITYKKLHELSGYHWRALRFPLSVIQNYCIRKNLPPLTILVVNEKTGLPGGGSGKIEYTEIF